MTTPSIQQEILKILERFPYGATVEEVMLGCYARSRRTFQRHLAILVQEGWVETLGAARARRYRLTQKSSPSTLENLEAIPLCSLAREVKAFVTKPLQHRPPVSYHREWLENYHPNQTFFLPTETRKHLLAIGKIEEEYPSGTFAKQIFARLLVDLSWNSSRLEGNTYSFLETEKLLQGGGIPEGKSLLETQMVWNHKAAIEFLFQQGSNIEICRPLLLHLHALLSEGLLSDSTFCGRLRVYPVGIAHSTYEPLCIPQVIEECFDLLLQKAQAIQDPFEQAFFFMVHIPYLQAFEDVNKRTSRLAANIPFLRHHLRPLSFVDVPEQLYIHGLLGVYEQNRVELLQDVFVWAYERSCVRYATTRFSLQTPDPFRLRYRQALFLTVREIVQRGLSQKEAKNTIEQIAKKEVLPKDFGEFSRLVEKELASLHEGNIIRYQISPREFLAWKNKP